MSVAEAVSTTSASLGSAARVAELTALIRTTSGESLKILRRTPRA